MSVTPENITTNYLCQDRRLMEFVIQHAQTDESYAELFDLLVEDDQLLRNALQLIKNLVHKVNRLHRLQEQLVLSIGFKKFPMGRLLALPLPIPIPILEPAY